MMNRYLKMISLVLVVSMGSAGLTGCYGRFILTKKLYRWNGTVGNKFVNTAVMWALLILPVYEFAAIIDFVALNTIEFWTGKNPMVMKEGEVERQKVVYEGTTYELTATKNRLDVVGVDGANAGLKTAVVYVETDQAWYAEVNGRMEKIVQMHPEVGAYELLRPAEN